MSKCCKGCGIALQNERIGELGYVEDLEKDFCKRCFRLRHYHEFESQVSDYSVDEFINIINKDHGLVIFCCDFLNLYQENIDYYKRIQLPKVFVVTKRDIIPKSIYFEKIKMWLRNNWDIKEQIFFLSKRDSQRLKKIIEKNDYEKIYFLGPTNAGKSSLIESILLSENMDSDITISEFPNTTLNFIKIPYRNKIIYDTVGFVSDSSFEDSDLWKRVNVKKEIKPLIYPVQTSASLLLEENIRIKFKQDVPVVWFGSDKLRIKKVYSDPTDDSFSSFSVPANTNVYIKGLGFFYLKEACDMQIYGCDKNLIVLMPSFMGSVSNE